MLQVQDATECICIFIPFLRNFFFSDCFCTNTLIEVSMVGKTRSSLFSRSVYCFNNKHFEEFSEAAQDKCL